MDSCEAPIVEGMRLDMLGCVQALTIQERLDVVGWVHALAGQLELVGSCSSTASKGTA